MCAYYKQVKCQVHSSLRTFLNKKLSVTVIDCKKRQIIFKNAVFNGFCLKIKTLKKRLPKFSVELFVNDIE